MRKTRGLIFVALLCCLGLSACENKTSTSEVIEAIIAGEEQEVIGVRYDSMSNSTRFVSCSVYQEFSEKAMEELGKALYEQVAGENDGPVSKCSIVFYENDTEEILHAFYYNKDGVTLDMNNAYYVPGDVFELFEPEG